MPAPTQRHSNVAFFCATILDFKTNRIKRCFLKTWKGGVILWRKPMSRLRSGRKNYQFGRHPAAWKGGKPNVKGTFGSVAGCAGCQPTGGRAAPVPQRSV